MKYGKGKRERDEIEYHRNLESGSARGLLSISVRTRFESTWCSVPGAKAAGNWHRLGLLSSLLTKRYLMLKAFRRVTFRSERYLIRIVVSRLFLVRLEQYSLTRVRKRKKQKGSSISDTQFPSRLSIPSPRILNSLSGCFLPFSARGEWTWVPTCMHSRNRANLWRCVTGEPEVRPSQIALLRVVLDTVVPLLSTTLRDYQVPFALETPPLHFSIYRSSKQPTFSQTQLWT